MGIFMGNRVAVHHFVVNLTTRQYGPSPTSDLLGVNYWFTVPADAEFPRWLTRVDVFTRFYVQNAKPVEFIIAVKWLDDPIKQAPPLRLYGPFSVPFHRTERIRDHVFRLVNVRLNGVGKYVVYCHLLGGSKPSPLGDGFSVS
jgi:hypothetical protein